MVITEKMFLEMLSILTRDKEQKKRLAEVFKGEEKCLLKK